MQKTKGVVTDTFLLRLFFGWKMGFEPTTLGTTILYSNRLSYIHHMIWLSNRMQIYTLFSILQNFIQLFLNYFISKILNTLIITDMNIVTKHPFLSEDCDSSIHNCKNQ